MLPNGKVLVLGGINSSGNLTNAELYDPASGTWTNTGSLNAARYQSTATLLPDGQVLVAGGYATGGTYLASAELYDPAGGTWTNTGSLNTARGFHSATLLPNGQVLVMGGLALVMGGGGISAQLTSSELYDPATGTWTPTGSLNTGALEFHSDVAVRWPGFGRGRPYHQFHLFGQRGALRSGRRDVDQRPAR